MAKGLIWSPGARAELLLILNYWDERNGSDLYSKKLLALIMETLSFVCRNPLAGKQTSNPEIRVCYCSDYLLFYRNYEDSIVVLSVYDGRRKPRRL